MPDEATARHLHGALGRLHREHLAPVLDRCFDALELSERVLRIDRLELDLGPIDPGDLGRDLARKLEPALVAALSEQLREESAAARPRGEDPELSSQLELIGCFARTGSLPWWADASNPSALDAALELVLRRCPAELAALVRVLAGTNAAALERLVRHADDAVLTTLSHTLLASRPELREPAARLPVALGAHLPSTAASAATWRNSLWFGVLRAAASVETSCDLPQLLGEALESAALSAGMTYQMLLAEFVDRAGARHPVVDTLLARGSVRTTAGSDPTVARGSVRTTAGSDPTVARVADTEPVRRDRPEAGDEPANELYVDNAGLVLLWPFLVRFFEKLGLCSEGRFADSEALHRAAGLLQHVATGDLAPPEYQLALPKVLVGMAPDALWEFGAPVTPDELRASDELIAAAVAHAPSLGELSVAGFRGSFLLRKGVLSTRDGAWLLCVEREPYDVLLERLPWSSNWIALPWMPTPLCVEW